MKKARLYTSLDFTDIKPEQVQRMVKDLYSFGEDDKREMVFGKTEDRRQEDRRQLSQTVILDTRENRSRRQSAGRRQKDENEDNKHKVGIDYYA
ncbi:MAG: hypothetical protein OEY52_02605 [Gammaproteobacteria bacterium]|nr:hypothetical protein [Gammaproteobacteria bacterium]